MIKRFVANDLVRNLDKANIMKFITKNSTHCTLYIGYREKYVEGEVNTKFLGLQTDNHINWKAQIEQMTTLIINQQCTHIKLHIKTLKLTPTCFDLLDHPQGVTFFLAKVILKYSHFNMFL